MHPQWQDLMAFYLAGTLSPAEAAALEQHLAGCEACRRALNEWALLAGAVHAQADEWTRSVPPLAPQVHASILAQRPTPSANGYHPHERAFDPAAQTVMGPSMQHLQRRQRMRFQPRMSLTLAAAGVVVVLFAGLLVWVLGQNNTGSRTTGSRAETTGTPAQTLGVAISQYQATNTVTPFGSPAANSSNSGSDLGILPGPATSTPAPTRTMTLAPTPVSPTPNAMLFPAFTDRCTLTNTTSSPISLYTWPNFTNAVAGVIEPGESGFSVVKTADGWHQIVIDRPASRLSGWLPVGILQASGPCDALPLPSPTAPTTTLECRAAVRVEGSSINLHTGPGRTYPVQTTLVMSAPVVEQSDNGWYHVFYTVFNETWVGWVAASDVVLYGPCQSLPIVPASEFGNLATSTPTPAPPATLSAQVTPTACRYFFGASEGCPSALESTTWAAYQAFEGGAMVWREDRDEFYVLFNDHTVSYFTGSQINGLPENPITDTPPAQRYVPVRGFGRVWGNYTDIRNRLGWALATEEGYTATVQPVNPQSIPGLAWYITTPQGRIVAVGSQLWRYAN